MKVLFVAATGMEVGRFVLDFGFRVMDAEKKNVYTIPDQKNSAGNTLLITGVGMVATAYSLGKELAANQYDLAINFGIAGSFDRSIELGDVVEVVHDNLSELGAEDNDSFLPVSVLGLGESEFRATQTIANIFKGSKTSPLLKNLKQVSSITVNTVHGEPDSIAKVQKRLNPQLESMEGAAFFYVCQHAGIPCVQIRAVSNYVEKRDKDNWKIGLAVKNLNAFMVELLNGLQVLQP
ncbi:futalosine hydrolase [Mucilaginibacter sp. 14171R-50]|uniref:futalosine hydrolase n=1 Tax=Mucilaginibacter sp. 14171R-50 TaxID=2703789 RepID=UPI00138D93C5|nr:futalosine hydrolase [Mucilaginibacter sp. 14171R-50]QHS55065.1 futalosine hydrolase [Mucilaginibacter sp. 14171R-50]